MRNGSVLWIYLGLLYFFSLRLHRKRKCPVVILCFVRAHDTGNGKILRLFAGSLYSCYVRANWNRKCPWFSVSLFPPRASETEVSSGYFLVLGVSVPFVHIGAGNVLCRGYVLVLCTPIPPGYMLFSVLPASVFPQQETNVCFRGRVLVLLQFLAGLKCRVSRVHGS